MSLSLLRFGVIATAVAAISGGGFFFYKWSESRSDKQIAAIQAEARNAGLAEGRKQVSDAQNAALLEQVKQIVAMTNATNKEMARIRVEADVAKQTIDGFEVQNTAVEHPEVVEQWANKTTGDLFAGIQQASQPEATDPK